MGGIIGRAYCAIYKIRANDMVKIKDAKLYSLYFSEMFWLTSEIKKNCEAIFEKTPLPEKGYYIKVSPELHALIISVLIQAANLKKLIITPSKKYKSESTEEYEFRQHRSKNLQKVIEGIPLEELFNNKVRNSLEHFDEHLDKANIALNKKGTFPSAWAATWAAYNMTLSHWELFKPPPYPVRVYIVNERKFYNFNYCIDLGKIYSETLAILERLRSSGLLPKDEPGGLLIKTRDSKQ